MVTTKQPNEEQLAALATYAERAGDDWKTRLSSDWMRAGSTTVDISTYSLLHQVRNNFGPSWLHKFDLEPYKLSRKAVELVEDASNSGATAQEVGKDLGIGTRRARTLLERAAKAGRIVETGYVLRFMRGEPVYELRCNMKKVPGGSIVFMGNSSAEAEGQA